MTTQNQLLRDEWVDVKASLSLLDDQKYTFQCTGSFEIRIVEDTSTPDINAYGHQMERNDLLTVQPASGVNIYARCVASKNLESNLTVTEAV